MTNYKVAPLTWLRTKFAELNHTHSEYVNPTIVDNLTSDDNTKVLSAKQGKVLKTSLDGKANSSHNHDDRYYTETEIDNKIITDVSGLTDNQGLLFSGDYDDLTDKPTIPSSSSDLTDGSNIIKKSSTNGLIKNDGSIDTNTYLTSSSLNGYQTTNNLVTSFSQSTSDTKYPSEKLTKNSLDGKVDKVTGKGLSTNDFTGYYKGMIDGLSEVATTGSYNDLTNKPSYTPTITSSTTGAYKIGSINVSGSNVDIYGKDIDTVYTHPTYSNVAKSTSAIYKFKTNSLGHIIEISTVSASDLPSHTHDDRYYTESEINGKLAILDDSTNNTSAFKNLINISQNYGSVGEIYFGSLGYSMDYDSIFYDKGYGLDDEIATLKDISDKENTSNKVISLSSSSTDTQYPSAKVVYNQLSTKAPTSHASSSTTYGVATSSNYGHTKVINNLTTSVASNGQALNAYQGKVLNDNKVDKNDFNVNYLYSFVYNSSIEKYAYQGQSGAVGIGISAMDENDNSLLNEDGVAIIDLVFQNTNINYGSIQLVLAEADGRSYSYSGDLSNTQTIATISDTNEHHITVVVSSDTHIEEQGYDYYDLKVSKISYDGSNITVSSGKTSMERVGVYLVFNGAIGGNIEYMNVIKRTPIVNQIIDIIYPIGSTYISVNSVNPSFLFGGEWEQIQDRFLLASGSTYSAGSTGGSADATLVSHQHGTSTSGEYFVTSESDGANNTRVTYSSSGNRYVDGMNDNKTPFHHRVGTGYVGSSGTGKNMPPYLTVYMWKRIG